MKNLSQSILKMMQNILISPRLNKAIEKCVNQWNIEKSISTENLTEFLNSLTRRLFGIRLFYIVLSILPLYYVIRQTSILSSTDKHIGVQNTLIDKQNKLVEIQNLSVHREELYKIISELSLIRDTSKLTQPRLSKMIQYRVIYLSKNLLPLPGIYNGVFESKKLSPERGLIFSTLISGNFHPQDVNYILTRGYFQYSDLRGVTLENSQSIQGVDLSGTDFSNSKLSNIGFKYCNLENVTFQQTEINNVNWGNTLEKIGVDSSQFKSFIFYAKNFK